MPRRRVEMVTPRREVEMLAALALASDTRKGKGPRCLEARVSHPGKQANSGAQFPLAVGFQTRGPTSPGHFPWDRPPWDWAGISAGINVSKRGLKKKKTEFSVSNCNDVSLMSEK